MFIKNALRTCYRWVRFKGWLYLHTVPTSSMKFTTHGYGAVVPHSHRATLPHATVLYCTLTSQPGRVPKTKTKTKTENLSRPVTLIGAKVFVNRCFH